MLADGIDYLSNKDPLATKLRLGKKEDNFSSNASLYSENVLAEWRPMKRYSIVNYKRGKLLLSFLSVLQRCDWNLLCVKGPQRPRASPPAGMLGCSCFVFYDGKDATSKLYLKEVLHTFLLTMLKQTLY